MSEPTPLRRATGADHNPIPSDPARPRDDPLLAGALHAVRHAYRDALPQAEAAIDAMPEHVQSHLRAVSRDLTETLHGPEADHGLRLLITAEPRLLTWAAAEAIGGTGRQPPNPDRVLNLTPADLQTALVDPGLQLAREWLDAFRVLHPNVLPNDRDSRENRLPHMIRRALRDGLPHLEAAVLQVASALRAARGLGVDLWAEADSRASTLPNEAARLRRAQQRIITHPDFAHWDNQTRTTRQLRAYQEENTDMTEDAGREDPTARPGRGRTGEPKPDRIPPADGSGPAGTSATSPLPAFNPCRCDVAAVPLDLPGLTGGLLPTFGPHVDTSVRHLRSLLQINALGEGVQLFGAAGQLGQIWGSGLQGVEWDDDISNLLYCLNQEPDQGRGRLSARNALYRSQLANPVFENAWNKLIAAVSAYLADPCTCCCQGGVPADRCIGIYAATNELRQVIAAQLTGHARMQIHDLAEVFTTTWGLLADPTVAATIAAGRTADNDVERVLGIVQTLLDLGEVNLLAAYNRATALDDVMDWVAGAHRWTANTTCDAVAGFPELLASVRLLLLDAEQRQPTPPPTPITVSSPQTPPPSSPARVNPAGGYPPPTPPASTLARQKILALARQRAGHG